LLGFPFGKIVTYQANVQISRSKKYFLTYFKIFIKKIKIYNALVLLKKIQKGAFLVKKNLLAQLLDILQKFLTKKNTFGVLFI
jgi:hypothetical protein